MPQKPIPLTILQKRKTNRRHRHGDLRDQVSIDAGLPTIPRIGNRYILGKEGRKEWKRITELLQNAKVLTEADRAVLTLYCSMWEQFVANPVEFNAAKATQLRLCLVELGLTPSSRTRLRNSGGQL